MKQPSKKKKSLRAKAKSSKRAAVKAAKPSKQTKEPQSRFAKGTALASGKLSALKHWHKTRHDKKSKEKAKRLAAMPKSRVKRILYRLHPKRLAKYWFSKQGALMALRITGIGFATMVVLILSVFAYFRRELPDPRDLNSQLLSQSTKFYDRSGENLLFEVYGDENRTVVEFDEISNHSKWATVAIEDKDFYDHGGVSFSGIFRAAFSNLRSGDATGQGGSTITQQFIKNSLLSTEQTYTRKIKEIILAIELERLYTKDEILSFYLNRIPYGPQEYGIQAAAQSFFGKDAIDLNIQESAILAALPQAPTFYSPYGENTDILLERKDIVIDLMKEQGYITQEEADEAKEADVLATITPIDARDLYANVTAPHFVDEVKQQLDDLFGATLVQSGGLKVITTLDVDLQKIAEDAIVAADGGDGFCDTGFRCGDNAAFVSTEVETGQVVALVGSRSFDYPEYGSFNAALADRQPGSSFKPFDYAQLFYNTRWGPDSYIYDTRTDFGNYRPDNFDFGFRGRMLVRQALGESRNIPAVKAGSIAGIDEVANLSIAMGNQSLADDEYFDLSYSLGAGEVKLAEHAHAYATFARGGKHVPQTYILSVESADGNELLKWEQEAGEQVLDEQIAYLITDVLKDDAARSRTFGFGSRNLVVPGVNHTVKTGTTDNSVDGWMMGYSKHYSFGVWVGNHDNAPMGAALTSQQTGPIFTQFIANAYDNKTDLDRTAEIFDAVPDGIKTVVIDSDTGYAASDESKNKRSGIFPSWYIPEFSDTKTKYTIDTVTGNRATECTPERAKEEKTGGGLWPEILPDDYRFPTWSKSAGYGASGGGPTEEDDLHKCSDKLPSVSLSTNEIGNGVYELEAEISKGTHKLQTVNFKVNGQIVSSDTISGNKPTKTFTHTFSQSGDYTVSAEVIDEALYDNTDSESVTVSITSFEITSHSNGDSNVPVNDSFSWTSDAGADQYNFCYKKASAGSYTCLDNGLSTSYSPGLDSSTVYNIKIQSETSSAVTKESGIITIETN